MSDRINYTARLSRENEKLRARIADLERQLESKGTASGPEALRDAETKVLRLVACCPDRSTLIRSVVHVFREQCGFESVGIRLKDGEDFPYFETSGFDAEFVEREKCRCCHDSSGVPVRDDQSAPTLTCLCGEVIRGQCDRSRPGFTADGSLWTNQASTDTSTCKQCRQSGYESVGLFVLRAGDDRLGLLQLNDRRKHRFTAEMVALCTHLAQILAVVVSKLRAEEALAQQTRLMQCILATTPDYLTLKDANGAYQEMSQSFCKWANRPREEVLGQTDYDLFPPDEAAMYRRTDAKAMQSGQRIEYDNYAIGPNGRRWHRVMKTAVTDASGHPTGVLASIIDIDERKKAEEHLHHTTEQLRLALVAARAGLWYWDSADGHVEWSPELFSLFGLDPSHCEPSLEAWRAVIHPDDRERASAAAKRAAAERIDMLAEYRVMLPNGAIRWISVRGNTTGEDNSHPAKLIGLCLDITERKLAEADGKANRAKLEAALSSMTDAVFITDNQGKVIEYNNAFLAFHRFHDIDKHSPGLDQFPHFLEIFKADGSPATATERAVPRALRGESASNVEYALRHKVTGETWVGSYSFSPILGRDGSITGAVVAARDITELKRVQQRLTDSEARHRALVEAAFDCIWELDAEGRYRFISPQVNKLLGYTPEEMLNRTPSDFMPAERADQERMLFAKAAAEHRPFIAVEKVSLHKDGHRVVLETSGVPVFGPGGAFRGYHGIQRDVTERRKAEEALRESERHHRAILQTAMDGICQIGREGHLVEVNNAYCQMTGYSEQELLAMRAADMDALESPAEVAHHIKRIALRGDDRFESALRRKDGSTFPVEVCTQYKEDNGGYVVAFVRDISERKRVEQALRESEERWKYALEGSGDGVWDWNRHTGVLHFTDQWKTIAGYSDEEIGTSVREWLSRIHPDDYTAVFAAWNSHVRGDAASFMSEHRLRCKDGTYKWVLGRGKVIECNANGKPTRVIGTMSDITARKHADEERAELESQLLQAQKMESIGRLAGGVAHDFNNLLTVINGYSQMLLAKVDGDVALRPGLTEIYRAGKRAAALTGQLLSFSRKQMLQPLVLDLNRVIDRMRTMLARLVGEDVELRINLRDESIKVHADPHQLEQMIMNLAVNARDAMPSGGSLVIQAAIAQPNQFPSQATTEDRTRRWAVLTVTDTGIGMNPETQKRIFEPFFTTKEVGRGSGLGLAMVQGTVSQSGGHISVFSDPGHGTTFLIWLPLASGAVTEERANPAPAPPPLGGRETILAVEDQPEVRSYTEAVLKSYGYNVLTASGAEQAEALCATHDGQIDLLLTDVVMPLQSGPELSARLTAAHPGLRVVYMSGYTDNLAVQPSESGQDVGFIQKPFSPQELATVVRSTLEPIEQPARILIADDEPGVRSYIRAVLERSGHEVIEAAEGKQALHSALRDPVDLVITDLVMPEQEGIETIRALRREAPGIAIIAISGAFGGQFLKVAQAMGANAVLAKPVSANQLMKTVNEVLARPQRTIAETM